MNDNADVAVEYIDEFPEVSDDIAAIFARFKDDGPSEALDEEGQPEAKGNADAANDEEEDDEEETDLKPGFKRKGIRRLMREARYVDLPILKSFVKHPERIEQVDCTAPDPYFIAQIKDNDHTVAIPSHWSSRRQYMSGKRGSEKPPFQLPDFIEQTGIAKIREAILQREARKTAREKAKAKVRPKQGLLDIDYQVLHDAFFKYQKKPKGLSKYGELYFEGKEFQRSGDKFKAGQLSDELKVAVGMTLDGLTPPPWLYNMQRHGPPKSYPRLKIPGLNAPIPYGAEYGYSATGWGKPPVNEYGMPLYGTMEDNANITEEDWSKLLWGEVDPNEDEESTEEEPEIEDSEVFIPVASHQKLAALTPLQPETLAVNNKTRNPSKISPDLPQAPQPTMVPVLFETLEQQLEGVKKNEMFPSNHSYNMPTGKPTDKKHLTAEELKQKLGQAKDKNETINTAAGHILKSAEAKKKKKTFKF